MKPDDVKNLAAARALLCTGLKTKDVDKPLVAILYSQNEITPGHILSDNLADYVKKGIESEGGEGIKMNAGIGICDGIAMGHEGMKLSLPSRELNRDAAISMVLSHNVFDGVVYIGACDKHIPGYLMAAASNSMRDLPGIFVTAGPMKPGFVDGKKADVVTAFSAEAQYKTGTINKAKYDEILEKSCPGAGSCAGLFTANSMACVTEALGLTVPGMATAHAIDDKNYEMAKESGKRIMKLIEEGITINDILSESAFDNAFAVDMAIGASTNTVLHVPAIAKEIGFTYSLDRINEISQKTPNLVRLSPASEYRMDDFDDAGGIPVVMSRLRGLLDTSVLTVTGSLESRLYNVKDNGQADVIKSFSHPYSETGGIAIYKGNLAPEGSVIKESGVDPSIPSTFVGTARVFNNEEAATAYIKDKKVQKGDVIVIRYEGPAGGPGMREMLYPTSAISGLGIDKEVALITDGRFSGGTKGICIGHIEPEAYNGGPLAHLRDGDKIEINMNKKEVNVLVNQQEFMSREFEKIVTPTDLKILQNYRQLFTK